MNGDLVAAEVRVVAVVLTNRLESSLDDTAVVQGRPRRVF